MPAAARGTGLGLIGAVVGAAFFGAGSFAQWAADGSRLWLYVDGVLAHATVGCGAAMLSGGNCGKGALSAAIAEAAGPLEKSAAEWGGRGAGIAAAGIVGGAAARAVGGSFSDGFSVGAAGYLFNAAAHTLQEKVDALSRKLTDAQAAATLHFFNPGDQNPLTLDQITQPAKDLAAEYVVKASEVQGVANLVEHFDNPVPTGPLGSLWDAIRGFFGFGRAQVWTWSTDIPTFNRQLTDRFGGAARAVAGTGDLSTRYAELKQGT